MPTNNLDLEVHDGIAWRPVSEGVVKKQHSHYYKDVSKLDFIDVYRVLHLFKVSDPCIQHAVKKLLVAGGRGAGKDISKDIQESIDSLKRWQEMRQEEALPQIQGLDTLESALGPRS
jgi:hypothetical protein